MQTELSRYLEPLVEQHTETDGSESLAQKVAAAIATDAISTPSSKSALQMKGNSVLFFDTTQAFLGVMRVTGLAGLAITNPSLFTALVVVGSVASLRGVKKKLSLREALICKELYEGATTLEKDVLFKKVSESAKIEGLEVQKPDFNDSLSTLIDLGCIAGDDKKVSLNQVIVIGR